VINIGEEQRKERNLTFHSWRHFFNPFLLTKNVTDTKVMAVTGHMTEKMKEHYTHFDATQFTEVIEAQESLMKRRGGKEAKGARERSVKAVSAGKKKTVRLVLCSSLRILRTTRRSLFL
jgi:hypothetical protein